MRCIRRSYFESSHAYSSATEATATSVAISAGGLGSGRSMVNGSPMSTIYHSAVRTESFKQFRIQLEELSCVNGVGSTSTAHFDGLLEPNQNAVEAFLQERVNCESVEMLAMLMKFFENSLQASTLCGRLLNSVHLAKEQWYILDSALAEVPKSGETLGFQNQQVLADCLSQMVHATNPFAESEAKCMIDDVKQSYQNLHTELKETRNTVKKEVRILDRWRGGCAAVVAVVVGVTAVVIIVATHALVSIATAPVAAAVLAASKRSAQASPNPNPNRWFCFCRRRFLVRQTEKLDALVRETFSVKINLDTLRCMASGLHDEVERYMRLVAFGFEHREEASYVHEIAKQLCKNHIHLVKRICNFEEQLIICFLNINKSRDTVLREFSCSSKP